MALHRQSVLIIIFITLMAFANVLSNGFVGDDYLVIVDNALYETWENFPQLFTSRYITDAGGVFNFAHFSHTGSVAYRPVLSATFFFDYWLWQRNAFGYHLHNLCLHVFNAVLVYFILFLISKNFPLALLGAVLFAVHPVKSEAVSSIGYRADILASFFFLSAFLSYIRQNQCRGFKHALMGGVAHAAFFLAVFSKESAVVFIGILMAFDRLVKNEKGGRILKHLYGRYLGYVLITVFYLYVYLRVFPNSALAHVSLLGENIPAHVHSALNILVHYLAGFVWPLSVKALPPGYVPPADGHGTWFWLALFIFLTYRFCRWTRGLGDREAQTAAFFVAWFLIALVPVANLIPLVNPMAYRFMYLPSVGFLAAAAVILNASAMSLDQFFRSSWVGMALRGGIVILCMTVTFSLNMAWRSNLVMAAMMVRDFPASPLGYLHLGMAYFKTGAVDKAEAALQESLAKGMKDPRGYYFLGLCYFNDWAAAKPYYEESIRLFPRFALSYTGLGRIYVLSGRYAEAVPYLEKAVMLAPSYSAYGYLIQSYLRLNRPEEAWAVYQQAQGMLKQESQRASLERLMKEGKNWKGAVDIGI